jgi:hypothetical protein
MSHWHKTVHSENFNAINSFRKTFEARPNEGYQENDIITLYEWNAYFNKPTGKAIRARIGFVILKTYARNQWALFSLLDLVKMPFPHNPPVGSMSDVVGFKLNFEE